jgi:hypothetical protein
VGGVFSNQLPTKDCITITVSPFQNANICPQESGNSVDDLFNNGFEDGIEWFMKRKRTGLLHPQLFQ